MAEPNAGDFEQFFRSQHPRLVAIALALTGDVELARDVAQEGLLRTYRDWARVTRFDRPSAWVRKVVVNLVIDGRRRRSRDVRLTTRLAGTRPPVDLDRAESSPTWEAVRQLPERQRAAVVLRYVDDLTVPEIADILGVAEGTVKASLHKARASLQGLLSEEVR